MSEEQTLVRLRALLRRANNQVTWYAQEHEAMIVIRENRHRPCHCPMCMETHRWLEDFQAEMAMETKEEVASDTTDHARS